MSDPLLGTSFGDTVACIAGDALRKNTPEAYHDAAQQIWGLCRLMTRLRYASSSFGGDPAWGLHDDLALSNEYSRMRRMEESQEMRDWWAAEMATAGLERAS